MSTPDNIPDWCDSTSDWINYILHAHGKAVNIPTVGNTGEDVHIGIIDTVQDLPDGFTDFKIAQEISVLQDVDEKWTSEHGIEVFKTISTFAPNATFSFIQAADSNDTISTGAFYDAIQEAISIGVDILNISADDASRIPISVNPITRTIQDALDEEIVVVAAIGNWYPDQDRPPIGCPAAVDDVIGVGGFVTECPCEPNENNGGATLQGPYYALKKEGKEYHGLVTEDTFYGWSKCYDGTDCIGRSIEKEWDRNPSPTENGPDVLAPVHFPRQKPDRTPYIIAGTSYAAPIVTAALALGYEECITETGQRPNHYHAMEALRQSRAPINHSDYDKLNATKLLAELKSMVS